MSADTDRTDPRTPDPLADALRIALDRLDAYIEGTDDESIIDGDTDEDREFIREARSALAALPSAPDRRKVEEATPSPEATLDVERLAEALHYVQALADGHGDPTAPPDESCVIDARNIAARLRGPA